MFDANDSKNQFQLQNFSFNSKLTTNSDVRSKPSPVQICSTPKSNSSPNKPSMSKNNSFEYQVSFIRHYHWPEIDFDFQINIQVSMYQPSISWTRRQPISNEAWFRHPRTKYNMYLPISTSNSLIQHLKFQFNFLMSLNFWNQISTNMKLMNLITHFRSKRYVSLFFHHIQVFLTIGIQVKEQIFIFLALTWS